MKSKLIIFLYMVLIAFVISSCKSRQKVVYSISPVEDKEYSELFSDILSSGFSFNTLSSKLNMNITTGSRSLSSRASLRMVKDDAIQISIQPLFGVEVFRFYIDTDSIVVLDRMNKRYVKESIDEVKEQYPMGFDFYTMQSILTNSIFVSGENEITETDYRKFNYTRTSDRNYYLIAEDPESQIEYSFTVNGDDRITFTHLMQHSQKQSVQWTYSDFTIIDNEVFPHKMSASVSSGSKNLAAIFQFSDIVTDEPIELAINVPDGYRKTSIAEVLKIITQN